MLYLSTYLTRPAHKNMCYLLPHLRPDKRTQEEKPPLNSNSQLNYFSSSLSSELPSLHKLGAHGILINS